MTTPTPKQRAELAARELITAQMVYGGNHHDVIYQYEVDMFLKVIPLKQLFAVEDALRAIMQHCDLPGYWANASDGALLALDNWRKEKEKK